MPLRLLAEELVARNLFARDAKIVVGVSGGPDSMALLHLLLDLNRKLEWNLSLHVAHLNHKLRPHDAEQDAAFVHAAADSLELPCTIEVRPISELAQREGSGIEEVGRRERYAFFERVCIRIGARHVAVGHHADDNAETLLHRILRGTGLRGLAGIQPSRPISPNSQIQLVRPLLPLAKSEILKYLADEGIAYREDLSNALNEPMRNRVRNEVLPMIETLINPQVRDALRRLSEQAQWLSEFLGETVARTFESLTVSRTDQELTINVDALARKSRIVQTELVRQAYICFGLGEQDLTFRHLVAVLDLVSDPTSGRKIQLPGGMVVERRYHRLIFSLPTDEPREAISSQIEVRVPGTTILPIRRLRIDAQINEIRDRQFEQFRTNTDTAQEFLDLAAMRMPLIVRSRRSGDRFYPLGAPGSKKIADFLTDAKVDPKERDRVAILADRLGPVWVIGHRIDDRVKLTSRSRKVLHLRVSPLDP